MRIQLIVEYDGTAYAGFQRQQNALSVQEVIERALFKLTRQNIRVTGASRTDAGVHARGQSLHFDAVNNIPPEKYAYALNTLLPLDVRVRASRAVSDDFHARFCAKGKLYRYQIYQSPHAGAINRNTHWHVIPPLDLEKMQNEAHALTGRHDFRAFAASGSTVKDTVRTIYRADIEKALDSYTFFIAGNGFLYNMVRIIAGTLVSVGAGKREPGAVLRALESGDRLALGVTAPAHGLTLMEVYYDDAGTF